MNILEKIGIVAIGAGIFFAVKVYCHSRNEKKAKLVEKAKILIYYHSELSEIFDQYLDKQKKMITASHNRKYDEYDYDDGYRGGTKEIFGRRYKVYNFQTDIEKIVSDKIIDLEKNPNEKLTIQTVYRKHEKTVRTTNKIIRNRIV
ncbi:MAG: hypothetical protein GZ087_11550 [Flavobacterium sp.]|nr:hypothetical protein [Flavobacterium sp.]